MRVKFNYLILYIMSKVIATIVGKVSLESVPLGDDKPQEAFVLTFEKPITGEKIAVICYKHLCFYVGVKRQITDDNVFPVIREFNVGDKCEVEILEHGTIKGSFSDNEPKKLLYINSIENLNTGAKADY